MTASSLTEPSSTTAPLGIIGAGAIGSTVARLAIAAGLDVVIANSRGPETLTDLITELGPRSRAATAADVARATDVVIVAVPLNAVAALPVAELVGKIVVDTTNYYPQRDGQISDLDEQLSTASELVQAHLVGARVVKAFSNITFASLGNGALPSGAQDCNALPLFGSDPDAKVDVAALLDALGYDAIDLGDLAMSWRSEPGAPAYCDPYMPPWPTERLSVDELIAWLLAAPVVPVPADRLRQLIRTAVRGPAGGFFPETAEKNLAEPQAQIDAYRDLSSALNFADADAEVQA